MRLFASLAVVQYHLWSNYLHIPLGHPGTDFFLALVGFVAALTQARRIRGGNWRAYIKGRYLRLYITFIPLFVITLAFKWQDSTWDWAIRSFLFVPLPSGFPVIGATWMLTMFMLFYFVFSLSFLARDEKFLGPLFIIWALLIGAYTWGGYSTIIPYHWENVIFSERNLEFILGYGAGIIARKHMLNLPASRSVFWAGAIGVMVGTVLLNLDPTMTTRSLLVGVPVTLFILGLAGLEQNNAPDAVVRVLCNRWLVWLGGASYVLYLSHGIVLFGWSMLLPVTLWLVPAITLTTVAASMLGYLLWEKPILHFVKTGSWKLPPLQSFYDFPWQKAPAEVESGA